MMHILVKTCRPPYTSIRPGTDDESIRQTPGEADQSPKKIYRIRDSASRTWQSDCYLLAAVPEPLTILVVDDEPIVLSSVTKMLKWIGHRPLLASSGQEALEICIRSGAKIDLLLTDIQMPEMSGIELAHCLAKIHSMISVLFMSGHQTNTPQMTLLLREGNFRVSEILRKPFSSKKLAQAIKNVMRQQRKQLAPRETAKTS